MWIHYLAGRQTAALGVKGFDFFGMIPLKTSRVMQV